MMTQNEAVCEHCKSVYDITTSDSFFLMQYCSEACENSVNTQTEPIEIYVCTNPMPIQLIDEPKPYEIKQGSKWRTNNKNLRGLSEVHLESLSGNIKDPVQWIEITNTKLNEHFIKVT